MSDVKDPTIDMSTPRRNIAKTLYGGTMPAEDQIEHIAVESPGPRPDRERAEALYGKDGGALSTLNTEDLADALDIPYDKRDQFAEQIKDTMSDLRVSRIDVDTVLMHINAGLREQPDAATVKRWERDAVKDLKFRYGDNWYRELQQAQRYLSKRPELKKQLNASGAGSKLAVMNILMTAARDAHWRGEI